MELFALRHTFGPSRWSELLFSSIFATLWISTVRTGFTPLASLLVAAVIIIVLVERKAGPLQTLTQPVNPYPQSVTYYALGDGDERVAMFGRLEVAGNFPETLYLTIDKIIVAPTLAVGGKRACLWAGGAVTAAGHSPFQEGRTFDLRGSRALCVVYANPNSAFYGSRIVTKMPHWRLPLTVFSSDSTYYDYPYDTVPVKSNLDFSIRTYTESGKVLKNWRISGAQHVVIRASHWEIEGASVDPNSNTVFSSGIVLRRPLSTRLLAPGIGVFFLVVLAFIFFVDSSTTVQIAVALGVGVWGARQGLLPGTTRVITGLDILTVASYGLIIVAVILSLGSHARRDSQRQVVPAASQVDMATFRHREPAKSRPLALGGLALLVVGLIGYLRRRKSRRR